MRTPNVSGVWSVIWPGWVAALAACASAPKDVEPTPDPAVITVAITSPAPGAELLAADHPMIVVSGTVATSDASQGALEAWVNGVRVDVVNGAFTARLTPEVGINHVKVEGGDGLGALVGKELDVLWAPEYLLPLPGKTGFDLAGALELRLGQRFFDARVPGTALELTTNPVVARDVASAVELILWHVDLASLVDGRIQLGQPGASLDLEIRSAAPTNIVTEARIIDTPVRAIDLRIDLLGVFLGVSGSFTFNNIVRTVDGGLTADLHASARLTLTTAEDGSIHVGVSSIAATLGQLEPAFTGASGEELNALFRIAGHQFRVLIEQLARDLIPTFTDRLPPLLESVLGAADQLLDNVEFTLDIGVGTPITLGLDGRIAALDVRAGTSGHVTVRQDLTLTTTGTPIHATSRGAARLHSPGGAPVFGTAGLHLTMRQDLLNALLHALWNAGLLEGELSAAGLPAMVSARLPPIIRPTPVSSPCKIDGERCDIEVQLGQIEVQLPSFGQSFGINASAGARIEVDGGAVSLAIQMVPELRVWETSATPGTLNADVVRELVASIVWPQLFGAIGNNLTIALPLPDLAALGLRDLAPGLADAELALQMRQRPSFVGERLVLGADLALTTPPPP